MKRAEVIFIVRGVKIRRSGIKQKQIGNNNKCKKEKEKIGLSINKKKYSFCIGNWLAECMENTIMLIYS